MTSSASFHQQSIPWRGRIMSNRIRIAAAVAALAVASFRCAAGGEYLLDNFTEALGLRADDKAVTRTDRENVKFGLACMALDYNLAAADSVDVGFNLRGREQGTVSVWVKGDASGNTARLQWRLYKLNDRGELQDIGHDFVCEVKLDFPDWRKFSAAPAPEAPADGLVRFILVQIVKAPQAAKTAGTICLDEMTVDSRLSKLAGEARMAAPKRLPDSRAKVTVALDVRNYSMEERAACNLQARLLDSKGNRIAEMTKQWTVPAGASQEAAFPFDAKLDDYVPPLELECDFVAASINATITLNRRIPMPTARGVLEDFSRVTDLWRGAATVLERYTDGVHPVQSVQPMLSPDSDTVVTRVLSDQPFGRFALEWKYAMSSDRDDIFYAQFMPGSPISMSVWVKGDGSGNRLFAGTRDWGRRVRGGNSQSEYFLHDLGLLTFTDWKQITFDLPGTGVGLHGPTGGTWGTADYPLELVGFSIRKSGDKAPAAGTIRIGSITIANQGSSSEALAVTLAAKEDDGLYRAGADAALATVCNTHLTRPRSVRLDWVLRGRDGKELAKGSHDLQLNAAAQQQVPVGLPELPGIGGPLTLAATLTDKDDPTAVATAQRTLSLPNAMKAWTFDESRQYCTNIYAFISAPGQVLAEVPGSALGPLPEPGSGRKCAVLNWARKADQPVALAPIMIEPALPGFPTRISVDVFGDGSGVSFYPLFCDQDLESDDSYCSQTAVVPGSVRIDFAGWRRLSFRAPVVHEFWDADKRFRRHHINYPLNLYLMAVADAQTKGANGKLLLDDLQVETQLAPAEMLKADIAMEDQSDFLPPGKPIRARLTNHALAGSRPVKLDARIAWPDGTPAAQVQRQVDLPAGKETPVDIADKGLPRGAYWLSIEAAGDGATARLYRPLVVMEPGDLAPGAAWPASFQAAVKSTWPEVVLKADALKLAVGEFRDLVGLDWDLLEPSPQYFQLWQAIERLKAIRAAGGTTRMRLGFAAHWAADEGFEALRRGQYVHPLRDIGHEVDFWHVPEDIADWDNYVYRLARDMGGLVDAWQFWDNPDVAGPIQLKPDVAVAMLKSVRTWTRRYSPASKVMFAGLNVPSAPGYIKDVADAGGADLYDIINVKVNPGIHPPEVWQLAEYILGLQAAAPGKDILISEMDWPVEPQQPDGSGFNALGQARNLARAAILCHWMGVQQPAVRLANDDGYPTGTGLTYRLELGMSKRMTSSHLVPRPAYLALMSLRRILPGLKPYGSVEMDDLVPATTRVLVYAAPKGAAAILWRVEGAAALVLPGPLRAQCTGVSIYGSPVALDPAGSVRVSETPVLLNFPEQSPDALHAALLGAALKLDEPEAKAKAMALCDRVVPAVKASAEAHKYAAAGGEPLKVRGVVPCVGAVEEAGLAGLKSESFELSCPADADMVLRRRYQLAGKGHAAEVIVNGKSAGMWNLAHTRQELQGGLRDAFFVVPRSLLDAAGRQKVELRYAAEPGTTFSVWSLALKGRTVPLGQLAPIYAAQAVGVMSLDRNVVGDGLKIAAKPYGRGIGTHAWSVIEYPINKQFKSFSVLAGVDACSDGRGSVKFEILGDGRTLSSTLSDAKDPAGGKLAKTAVLTGLSTPERLVVDVTGVDRLTLVVHDGDDGNREDAADWLEPELTRAE